ncbi:hypothetical protein [Aliamphritea spongicola]|nr:hypothetical protein [Aliamphritea spongicola]
MAIDDRDYYKKQLIEKLDKLEADERRSAKGLKGRFRESRLAYEKDDVQSRPSPPLPLWTLSPTSHAIGKPLGLCMKSYSIWPLSFLV